MKNYLKLMAEVYQKGIDTQDRTGVGSRFMNGLTLQWNLQEGFPIVTTRPSSLRIAFEETMFFLRGDTDTKKLEEKGINIWTKNTTREFLDSNGCEKLEVGDIGTGYSHQWRNFGGKLNSKQKTGVDQIKTILDDMNENPYSRRHLFTGWNPQQLDTTPLPPCHLMSMYTIVPDALGNPASLNSNFILRSNDMPFGLPYNIMCYALINEFFSRILGIKSGDLHYYGWNAHIYQNQLEMVKEQIFRKPAPLPKLNIKKEINTMDDMLALEFDDIELIGYKHLGKIESTPEMAV